MAAIVCPPNTAGVNLPPLLQNPPAVSDVGQAVTYVTEIEKALNSPLRATQSTYQELGDAQIYNHRLTSLVVANQVAPAPPVPGLPVAVPPGPPGPIAIAIPAGVPPWLAAIGNTLNAMQVTLHANQATLHANQVALNAIQADIRMIREQEPILIFNGQAGSEVALYNPTLHGQWVHLVHPNPRTRDELLHFTQQQCVASATALALPPLPNNTLILERRRQIGNRIGVKV